MTHFRLPISDDSTHKSVNPQSLTINYYEDSVTYDGSTETTINLDTVENSVHSGVSDKVYLKSKTYNNVIGAAGCSNAAAPLDFWFASIRPTSWAEHWRIKVRVYAQVPGQINCHGIYEFIIVGAQSTWRYYHNLNGRGSQYPIYYDVLYTLKETGYNNGYGNLFGVSLLYATNYNNQDWKRSLTVEIVEADRCEVELFDTPLLYANVPGTGSTNYSARTAFDAASNGLMETGDSNTREVNSYLTAGVSGLQRYSLIMQEASGKWSSIAYTTSPTTANNYTDTTTRIASTGHYLADSVIMYSNNGSTRAPDSKSTDDRTPVAAVDFRYSSNCKSTLVTYEPLYLIFNENSDGTITPRSDVWWTQDPLSTSYIDSVFIYVGNVYATTSFYLISTQPRYKIVNNALVPYVSANWLSGLAPNLIANAADTLTTEATFTANLAGATGTKYNGSQSSVNIALSGILPVKYGGTGLNSITADALVLGNGTSALKTIAKSTTKGAVLGITDSNTVGYQTITFASTAGTNIGQTLALKVGDTTVDDIDLDLASTTQSGVVSTVAQAFKGTKTFNDGMHIYGTINMAGTSTTTVYSGGAYHGGHNSIVLHGDSAGVSGILFTSQLATDSATVTNVNLPTDRAFIQYHSRGVTPSTTDGTAPTLATSGEAGRLVIGIANDAASDMVVIQTGNGNDFRRLKLGSTNLYNVYDASNLTPTFGNWSIPTDNTPPEATLTFGPADSGTLKNRASVTIDLPVADQTHSGIINIVNQSIKGHKTFLDGVHSALFCVEDSSNAHKVQLEYNSTTKALDFNFV